MRKGRNFLEKYFGFLGKYLAKILPFVREGQRRRVSSRWSVDISDFISEGVMVSSADDAPLLRLRRNTHHSSLSVMRLQVMTRLVEKSISCSMVMLSNTETGEAVAVRLLVVFSFFDILLTLKKKNASSYPLSNGLNVPRRYHYSNGKGEKANNILHIKRCLVF